MCMCLCVTLCACVTLCVWSLEEDGVLRAAGTPAVSAAARLLDTLRGAHQGLVKECLLRMIYIYIYMQTSE